MGDVGLVFLIMGGVLIFVLAMYAFMWWKLFEKAGKKGWISIVPYYNLYTLFQISGKPGWWFAFAFIPYIGGLILLVLSFIANIELAKKFGKSAGFGVGMTLLGFIFYPILGYGSAVYEGGAHSDLSQHTDVLDAEQALGQDTTDSNTGSVPH